MFLLNKVIFIFLYIHINKTVLILKSKENPSLELAAVKVSWTQMCKCGSELVCVLCLIVQLKWGHSKTGSGRSNISIDWAVEGGVILSLTLSLCLSAIPPPSSSCLTFSFSLSLICYMTQCFKRGFSSNHVSTHCMRRHLSSFCHPLWWHFKHFDSFFLVLCREPLHSMVLVFAFTFKAEEGVVGGFFFKLDINLLM